MRSRQYTQEVGINVAERPVPTAVALAILALVAVVAIFFIQQAYRHAHHETAAQPATVKAS